MFVHHGREECKKKNSPATHYKNIVLCLQRSSPVPPLSLPPPLPPYIFFFIWKNSQLLRSVVQEYMYSLFNAESSLVSVCMYAGRGYMFLMYVCMSVFLCVCVCIQISSVKPLGQLKPNSMWNLHGIGEESLFKWSRSFGVLHYCQPLGGGGF